MSRIFSRDFRDIKYRFLQFLPFSRLLNTRDFKKFIFSRHLIPATFSTRDFFIFDWKNPRVFWFYPNYLHTKYAQN